MTMRGSGNAVGYGRPPLHTRFRKGQSGNPGGRPRRAPSLAELIEDALDRPAGSGQPQLTQREAIVARLIEKAAEGEMRAIHLLLGVAERGAAETTPPEHDPDEVEAARARLIDAFDRIAAEADAETEKERQEELMMYDEALWRQPAGASIVWEPL